jgi:hypothetical protein
MPNLKEVLKNLDTDLMYDVTSNVGSGMHSPDGEDSISKLSQYPAFSEIIVALNERFSANPNITEEERSMLFLGATICLEVFADYANAEVLRTDVNGAQ